jgi:hypothetical protein
MKLNEISIWNMAQSPSQQSIPVQKLNWFGPVKMCAQLGWIRDLARPVEQVRTRPQVCSWAGISPLPSEPKKICPRFFHRRSQSDDCPRWLEEQNRPVAPLPNPSHLLPHPAARQARERRARAVAASLAKPFHRCARSPEIECAAVEWPCGGALSGLRPSPVTSCGKPRWAVSSGQQRPPRGPLPGARCLRQRWIRCGGTLGHLPSHHKRRRPGAPSRSTSSTTSAVQ